MNNEEPSKCVYPKGEDTAQPLDKNIVVDEGAGQRKRYANTNRPIGVPTEVWESMIQADRNYVIRLAKIHAGKEAGASTSTDTGGPTDAAVAHVGGDFDDCNEKHITMDILNAVSAVPLPKSLPARPNG
eukprot:251029-Heterocapsa_arctica.AAC.1